MHDAPLASSTKRGRSASQRGREPDRERDGLAKPPIFDRRPMIDTGGTIRPGVASCCGTGGPQGAGLRHPPVFSRGHFSVLRTGPVRKKCWSPTSIPIAPSVQLPQLQGLVGGPRCWVKRLAGIHEEKLGELDVSLGKPETFGGPPTTWQGLVPSRYSPPWRATSFNTLRPFRRAREPRPKAEPMPMAMSPEVSTQGLLPPAHHPAHAGLQGIGALPALGGQPPGGRLAHHSPSPLLRRRDGEAVRRTVAATADQHPLSNVWSRGATFHPQPLARSSRPCFKADASLDPNLFTFTSAASPGHEG